MAIVCTIALALGGCVSVRTTTVSSFVSADGHFNIAVPGGTMAEQTSPGSGHYGGSTIHAFIHDEPGGLRFAAIYGDASDDYPNGVAIEEALADAEQANILATGGNQTAERSLTISGYPGREQWISSESASYVFRMLYVGSRAYVFSVKGTEEEVRGPMSVTYLGSIEVTQ